MLKFSQNKLYLYIITINNIIILKNDFVLLK